ncbi:cell division protein FtsX [Rhodovibrionaceae bacterium A322]
MKSLTGSRGLPLSEDASAKYLPWLIAFMVYLTVMALVAALSMQKIASRWDSALAGRLTVQIPASPDGDAQAQQARIQAAIEVLKDTPTVTFIDVLSQSEISDLLRPWLGEMAGSKDLPLPNLIAVSLDNQSLSLPAGLAGRLQVAVPGAIVDDHQRWLGGLLDLARSIELAAFIVVLLSGLSAVITIVFVTRTGLSIHQQVIGLLHLMGAKDNYIAGQFQNHALRTGLKGGLLGLFAAVASVYAMTYLLARSATALLPDLTLGLMDLVLLFFVPLVVALVAMLTARFTVLRLLVRLP